MEKEGFSTNGVGTFGYPQGKKMNIPPYLFILHVKINSRGLIDLKANL